jgi:hypothetical protein
MQETLKISSIIDIVLKSYDAMNSKENVLLASTLLSSILNPAVDAAKLPFTMVNFVSRAAAQLLWNLINNPTFGAESNSAAVLKCRQVIE